MAYGQRDANVTAAGLASWDRGGGMRRLEASIRTFNLDHVKVTLTLLGVTLLEISEAQFPATGAHGAAAFLPKVRVRWPCPI